MRIGEKWCCSNLACGAEIVVTKSSKLREPEKPVCGCGSAMKRPYEKPTVTRLAADVNEKRDATASGKE